MAWGAGERVPYITGKPWTCSVAKEDAEILSFLPSPPEWWDYSHVYHTWFRCCWDGIQGFTTAEQGLYQQSHCHSTFSGETEELNTMDCTWSHCYVKFALRSQPRVNHFTSPDYHAAPQCGHLLQVWSINHIDTARRDLDLLEGGHFQSVHPSYDLSHNEWSQEPDAQGQQAICCLAIVTSLVLLVTTKDLPLVGLSLCVTLGSSKRAGNNFCVRSLGCLKCRKQLIL